jgi:enamine deaminase RidA (YjgF/YER057c/UK114 family)
MPRTTHSTNSPWEPVVGYSRAVRSGPFIAVAGTTAWDPERGVVGIGDPAAQARHVFGIIRTALERLGGRLEDVIRVRVFLADIAHADAVGRVHAEVFGHIRPASTMLAGAVLVRPELLLEIEVDALVEATTDAGSPQR